MCVCVYVCVQVTQYVEDVNAEEIKQLLATVLTKFFMRGPYNLDSNGSHILSLTLSQLPLVVDAVQHLLCPGIIHHDSIVQCHFFVCKGACEAEFLTVYLH